MPVLAVNKSASFDYHLVETYEAGLELAGSEVKSAKGGHIQLKNAFVSIKNGELYLVNCHISAYGPAGMRQQAPDRTRKLLLHHKEIARLTGKMQEKGLTIVPVKVYTTRGLVKAEIALAKGKKLFEKKEKIKARDIDREMRRDMKGR
ncbi:MAG: SsrA-binding protein [Parcubacteria group bacterium Gr01-1014_18]|nr:MAG: SsrA-binding protein [Parcubacteria group bacterium Greene0416_36]TSC79881.1 MAG: SsrA-binding protein [Parcubacteria group bacterium Gr01-1014_18]TSC98313.1 MAG: SsrA-binding protein [Parcubacteria group bacterium Greene1014_20]TSD06646.1 MAG: SsrA-binding protein [Parcubacteria group bacterium Greene0714_2]